MHRKATPCAPGAVPVVTPNGPCRIRGSEHLTVDGAELFLLTRGADCRAPVLLWLHGGPGGAQRPLFQYYQGDLEDHFVVAYWDQRGAGRSYDPEADPRLLTITRHIADLDAIVDHLRGRFNHDTVILAGHSWGGALGLLYAREFPGKVSHVAAIAPLIAPAASQFAAFAFVSDEATARGEAHILAKLRELGTPPFENSDEVLALERLTNRYGGVFHQPPRRFAVLIEAIARGLVTPWEVPRLIRSNEITLAAMHDELRGLDLAQSVPSVDVPVLFLLGRHDRHVDSRIAARYLEVLDAPSKRIIWFERSAHNVPFEESARFREIVIQELVPASDSRFAD